MSSNEMVQCTNPRCKAWRLLYSEVVVFPWGAAFCKGECADMAREFRASISKGAANMLARMAPRRVRETISHE